MRNLLFASVFASLVFFLVKRDVLDLSLVKGVLESMNFAERVELVNNVTPAPSFEVVRPVVHEQRNDQSLAYINALISDFDANDLKSAQAVLSYLDLMAVVSKINQFDKGCVKAVFQFELKDARSKVASLLADGFFLPEEALFINQALESKAECFLHS